AEPTAYTLGTATEYQFMYGPNFLIAPIYQSTAMDKDGNDIRNNIYLPKGTWVDYFSGQEYEGDCIINSFDAPIWKLPVFVKKGAIIPMNNPNNHVTEIDKGLRSYEIYPYGKSSFTQYDDDGATEAYKNGTGATTIIESNVAGDLTTIIVHPSKGNFTGFVKQQATGFTINATAKPKGVTASVGGKNIKMNEVNSAEAFHKNSNVYFYNAAPNLNQFATTGSEFAKVKMIKNQQVWVKVASTDISVNEVKIGIKGFIFKPKDNLKQESGILVLPQNVQVPDSNKTAYSLNLTWNAVPNADFYEIAFNDMRYTTIKSTRFLFEDLQPETEYDFKIRAVNKTGNSEWAKIQAKTKTNPLEFAIHDIVAQSSAADEEDNEIMRLFDFDDKDTWHTKYGQKAIPFNIVMDLKTINQLDKFEYLPRLDGRNGMVVKGTVEYSLDKNKWLPADTFNWNKDNTIKTFNFANHPSARYIKINIEQSVGNYGSGRELYVFKMPGTESYLPGDINNDHKIDNNDLTSYMNYTGLRKGDADFEGYISKGDINKNGLIDAYDISVVATQLNGGVKVNDSAAKVSGSLQIITAKQNYKKGETIEVTVKGVNLTNVNALSFALPYNQQDYEYVGVQSLNTGAMENLTNDRLHSDGNKVLYPTFVNEGNKAELNGSEDLFIIKFKAKQNLTFNMKLTDGILIDKSLEFINF
ncbi:MAG: discoidin domain-containing protein, partial [Bacteroidota bacterium]|nr:discoidin domain-containing protein [Bacteroidota bacterium]